MGRPSLTLGTYFRSLLIGYFQGIDSERGVAWRLADSLSLRRFLAIEIDEQAPDDSTISRTRRLIDIEAHRKVLTWALRLLACEGLLAGGFGRRSENQPARLRLNQCFSRSENGAFCYGLLG